MFASGDNTYGQFGNGTMLGSYDLVEIDTGLHINQISAGSAHVVCVDTQGQVYGWGKCNNGQLSFRPPKGIKNQLTPVNIAFDKLVAEVRCGSLFTSALV